MLLGDAAKVRCRASDIRRPPQPLRRVLRADCRIGVGGHGRWHPTIHCIFTHIEQAVVAVSHVCLEARVHGSHAGHAGGLPRKQSPHRPCDPGLGEQQRHEEGMVVSSTVRLRAARPQREGVGREGRGGGGCGCTLQPRSCWDGRRRMGKPTQRPLEHVQQHGACTRASQ